MHRVLFGRHVVGHRAFFAGGRVTGIRDRDVVQQFDDTREFGFLTDRKLQRRDARAELLLQVVERAFERRAFAIEFVHEDRARDAALFGEPPSDFGLYLDAFDGGDDKQRKVGGLQRGDHVADEVGVARRVDHVDLVTLDLDRRERERHRNLAALFFGIEVRDGGPVVDLAHPGDGPGAEEQRLGQ